LVDWDMFTWSFGFTPIIVYNLIFSIKILSRGVDLFTEKCVRGIKANKAVISEKLEMDLSLSTALSPYIGYAKASEVARKAFRENKSIKQVCIEMKILDKKTLDRILDPQREAGR
jgi:aspartate ammonia-lyase